MCEKCDELQQKIDHYEGIARQGIDGLTIERIGELVKDLRAEKARVQH